MAGLTPLIDLLNECRTCVQWLRLLDDAPNKDHYNYVLKKIDALIYEEEKEIYNS